AYVLCTSGDVGIAEPGMTREKATEIREAEQTAAAKVVGVTNLIFLREPDGMLENTMALRERLVREIRRFKPEAVFILDPTRVWVSEGYINHPDHRAAGMAAIDAIFPAAGQPLIFSDHEAEGLMAHKVRKVYVMTFSGGDTYVDISDTIDLKIEALKQHKSQISDPNVGNMIKEWAGGAAKGKEMAYAETFNVITLVSDEDFEKMQTTA
ncbi:MAG: PIG-L deacetylase family protein, partial [Chloroflexota bacterium]